MSSTIYNSVIWRQTLDEKSEYAKQYPEEVDILRTSFKDIRRKATFIASFIKDSHPSLTLHDITHLDALWETAETIGGEGLKLNPVEAYVFGCAVLFHDMGMSLVLWEEQITNLKQSKEYKDVLFDRYSVYLGRTPEAEDFKYLPPEIEQEAISARLRDLHAFKARELPLKAWSFNGDAIYLIEQSELRKKLGDKIGIIAESHWWNVEDIRSRLGVPLNSPAPTLFPKEWQVNNVKLACLLRLADYVHIDDRRAPTLAFAILKPTGISKQHWTFQHKINRASCYEDRLTFESHSNFKYFDRQAWWLAYETIRTIDQELKAVDNLLADLRIDRLSARGVRGVETPLRFSSFVRTEEWEPADTQFKISDIRNIIEKLGGKQLYGDQPEVTLRELIQNASDAAEAKKYYSSEHHGVINVRYYALEGQEWLEVEDNGIGMSKSALIYGLLDFGASFWKTPLLRREHPGLSSSGFQPNGFGIGFFSVFMIADFIQVFTKSIIRGSTTHVLEIGNGLSSNPILRVAKDDEERFESGTLIRLAIRENELLQRIERMLFDERYYVPTHNPLIEVCRRIAPALTVNLVCNYERQGPIQIVEANDWKTMDPLLLMERISYSNFTKVDNRHRATFISPVFSEGIHEVIARGTIVPFVRETGGYTEGARVTVGGIVQDTMSNISGIWMGKNLLVSRASADPICTYKELQPWLAKQYELVIKDGKMGLDDRLWICDILCSLGFVPQQLPIALNGEDWCTYDDLVTMNHGDHVLLIPGHDESYQKKIGQIPVLVTSPYAKSIHLDRKLFQIDETWRAKLSDRRTGVDGYDRVVPQFSRFGITIMALSESWGVSEREIASESLVEFARFDLKDWRGVSRSTNAMVIVNPRKTNKETMLKLYEDEIFYAKAHNYKHH